MIKVRIHGIKDGKHEIKISTPVEKVEDMSPEFFGTVDFEGEMKKYGKRYTITGIAKCPAKMICDLSLQEYEEAISAEIGITYLANTALLALKGQDDEADSEERLIHEDEEYVDISQDVREELAVMLPMKRIAPEFRDKKIEEIFPEVADRIESDDKKEKIDERWSALKKLKLN